MARREERARQLKASLERLDTLATAQYQQRGGEGANSFFMGDTNLRGSEGREHVQVQGFADCWIDGGGLPCVSSATFAFSYLDSVLLLDNLPTGKGFTYDSSLNGNCFRQHNEDPAAKAKRPFKARYDRIFCKTSTNFQKRAAYMIGSRRKFIFIHVKFSSQQLPLSFVPCGRHSSIQRAAETEAELARGKTAPQACRQARTG